MVVLGLAVVNGERLSVIVVALRMLDRQHCLERAPAVVRLQREEDRRRRLGFPCCRSQLILLGLGWLGQPFQQDFASIR